TRLSAAAMCGLRRAVEELLAQLAGPFMHAASAAQLIEAAALVQRIAAGHLAGLPLREHEAVPPDVEMFAPPPRLLVSGPLLEAALNGLDGLRGSDEPADVLALVDLTANIRGDYRTGPQDAGEPSPLLPALHSRLLRIQ